MTGSTQQFGIAGRREPKGKSWLKPGRPTRPHSQMQHRAYAIIVPKACARQSGARLQNYAQSKQGRKP